MTTTNGVDGNRKGHSRPPLMDIEAVAHRLAVNVRHVRRLVTEKRIPYRKWGHLLRFEPEEVEAWIEASRIPERPDRVAQGPGDRHTPSVQLAGTTSPHPWSLKDKERRHERP